MGDQSWWRYEYVVGCEWGIRVGGCEHVVDVQVGEWGISGW